MSHHTWLHRIVRPAVRPLVGTAVTPNHLTALRLITGHERACLRIYRRPDGTVVTADCWSRLRAARRRGLWAFVAMLMVIGWAELSAIFVGMTGLRRVTRGPAVGEMRGAAVMPKPDAGQARLPSVPPPPGVTVTAGVPPLHRMFPPAEMVGKRKKPLQRTMGRVGHPIDPSE